VGTAPWACGTSDAAMPLLDARPFCFPIAADPSSRPLPSPPHESKTTTEAKKKIPELTQIQEQAKNLVCSRFTVFLFPSAVLCCRPTIAQTDIQVGLGPFHHPLLTAQPPTSKN
jgi:hypothetical protein